MPTITNNVKNQYEMYLYYSFEPIRTAGELAITGSGAGTYTPDETVPGTGVTLYARVKDNAIGANAVVITVVGNTTGSVTIPARFQEGQAREVTDSYGDAITFTSITSVTFTGGTAGEEIELLWLPAADQWVNPNGGEIGFDQNFSFNPGVTSRAIPKKYEPVDHWKRTRGTNSFSIGQLYENFDNALTFLRGRDVTLRLQRMDDGGADITEYIYLDLARISDNPTSESDGGDVETSGDGLYKRLVQIGS